MTNLNPNTINSADAPIDCKETATGLVIREHNLVHIQPRTKLWSEI